MKARHRTSAAARVRAFPEDGARVQRFGDPRSAGGGLFVSAKVLRALSGLLEKPEEGAGWFALLLGRVHSEGDNRLVEVRTYAELQRRLPGHAFVMELVQEWERVRNRLSRTFPEQALLGWASLRRSAGGEPLPSELLLHNSLFHLPHQVMILIDSRERSISVHGRDAQGVMQPIGFNVVWRPDTQGAPLLSLLSSAGFTK